MGVQGRPDETAEWLNYLQPEGVVVGANVLREKGLTPIRQTPLDTEAAAEALRLEADASQEEDRRFVLADAWRFFETILRWPKRFVAGSPGGPDMPAGLAFRVPEADTVLAPDMALLWNGEAEAGLPAQALVLLHPTLAPDQRNQFEGSEWEASPHQRLERLLRDSGVGVGILVAKGTLRLVHAPRGETAGWISWPLAPLGRVAGRPMLGGLKLCLDRNAFFTGPAETRLRPLLKASREAQNAVSEKLSGQVLGALHELLRGLHAADPERIEGLAERDPHHLYEGLLTCLMRLVFLLYAEDRDLLPSSRDPRLRQLWESGYSVKTLYARLLVDEALNPDTMDQRRGGWGQLLAVFRLIHGGSTDWVTARGGKLFDSDAFPFLEAREKGSPKSDAEVLPVSDGTILRILHGLMTIEGRSFSGEKIRERLSYRALDVERIGSVYETVMGFSADRAKEPMIALKDEKKLPAFVGLDSLLAVKPAERAKWLKDQAVKLSAKQGKAVKEADSTAGLLEAFGNAIDRRASPDETPLRAGAPFLQPTEERRRSGSHYTPRSLTEPIVRHALEPAFERVGENASPEAVLALKVLDPACGSGAFLVEACRQLGARLERAWDMHPAEKPTIPPDEDEALHARRLVAQRCLYGVDRNPMAVDLAKLSLWLATLASDHEFSFLDHALKAGDSLVGLTEREIAATNWDGAQPKRLTYDQINAAVETAIRSRDAIRYAPDDERRSVQESRMKRVERESERIRILGDATIAAFFASEKKAQREQSRKEIEALASSRTFWDCTDEELPWQELAVRATRFRAEQGWRPFHWQIEFPEVFRRDDPGFDSIVGNPPFAGKNTISEASGAIYLNWLKSVHDRAHGNADLVAHFFRRTYSLLREGSAFGLIATNTIGQGDTRATGLAAILASGGSILRAVKRYQWPNEGAAVIVSIVHIGKGGEARSPMLDERPVDRISAYLVQGAFDAAPARLAENAGRAFIGSYLLGMGFTFDDKAAEKGEAESVAAMQALIAKNPRNAERIKPYLGGEEVNNSPTHAHHRYAIDFEDFPLERVPEFEPWQSWSDERMRKGLREGRVPEDYPDPVAWDWPDLIEIVERRVKAARQSQNRERRSRVWWQYAETAPGLSNAQAAVPNLLVMSRVSPHLAVGLVSSGYIFAESLVALPLPNLSLLAVLQSRIHETWARFFSSSMKDDLRYAPSDCFETFPFPENYETDAALEGAGRAYHEIRSTLMVEANEGMTKTYNRFHDVAERRPVIARLRELHDAMDRAVLRAYGWHDLAESLEQHFLTDEDESDHTYQGRYFWPAESRDIVLARLLALNAERHAAEVAAGLHTARGYVRDDEDDGDNSQAEMGLD